MKTVIVLVISRCWGKLTIGLEKKRNKTKLHLISQWRLGLNSDLIYPLQSTVFQLLRNLLKYLCLDPHDPLLWWKIAARNWPTSNCIWKSWCKSDGILHRVWYVFCFFWLNSLSPLIVTFVCSSIYKLFPEVLVHMSIDGDLFHMDTEMSWVLHDLTFRWSWLCIIVRSLWLVGMMLASLADDVFYSLYKYFFCINDLKCCCLFEIQRRAIRSGKTKVKFPLTMLLWIYVYLGPTCIAICSLRFCTIL